MRLATVCSGIGVAEMAAMEVFGEEHELVFACEIDKFARASFLANHTIAPGQFHISVDDNPLNLYKKSFPYTVDFYLKSTKKLTKAQKKYFQLDVPTLRTLRLIAKTLPKFSAFSNVLSDEFLERYRGLIDILVGGTPCQNFSLAGLRQGLEGKTGILIWQYFRIVKALMPPVFVWENVKGFISDKKGKTLKDFLEVFRSIGYHCHYEVVDTKDYGVPQHRERIYIVGFLDVDAYYRFSFAPKQKLTKRLKDVLETDVDDKYYLSAEMINFFKKKSFKSRPLSIWTEQDVWDYIKLYDVPYSKIYDDVLDDQGNVVIQGEKRTGCAYCAFGADQEKTSLLDLNRFQRLKLRKPKQYNAMMKLENNGVSYDEALSFIHVKH